MTTEQKNKIKNYITLTKRIKVLQEERLIKGKEIMHILKENGSDVICDGYLISRTYRGHKGVDYVVMYKLPLKRETSHFEKID